MTVENDDQKPSPSILDSVLESNGHPFDKLSEMQRRMMASGWRWKEMQKVFDKMNEEIGELQDAVAQGDQKEITDEAGDVLYMALILCHYLNVDPNDALRRVTDKVANRFHAVEEKATAAHATVATLPHEQERAAYFKAKSKEKDCAPQ